MFRAGIYQSGGELIFQKAERLCEIEGDTDYENLLVGLQKTVIVRGTVECSSEKLLHGEESSKTEDSFPQDIEHCHTEGSYEAHDIFLLTKVLEIK
ncbi:hypothetical protein Pint_06856 [Pistacia integerrima]|uniref:Uncharacterized protein n=1 Tax=Pistacia integerrima TaxID=434235 RepID=A0ACC0Y0E6_9ROSI|nr:hypothetical protein Pint_06856 [Pistacia integerrima]